jgi:hypothetical protein
MKTLIIGISIGILAFYTFTQIPLLNEAVTRLQEEVYGDDDTWGDDDGGDGGDDDDGIPDTPAELLERDYAR